MDLGGPRTRQSSRPQDFSVFNRWIIVSTTFFFFQISALEDKALSAVLETFCIIFMYEHKVRIPYFLRLFNDINTLMCPATLPTKFYEIFSLLADSGWPLRINHALSGPSEDC